MEKEVSPVLVYVECVVLSGAVMHWRVSSTMVAMASARASWSKHNALYARGKICCPLFGVY